MSTSTNLGTGDLSGCCSRRGFYTPVPAFLLVLLLPLLPLLLLFLSFATSALEWRFSPPVKTAAAPLRLLLPLLQRLLSPSSRRRLGRTPAPRPTEPG